MKKTDLAFNNLRWLICHKKTPNQNLKYLIYMRDGIKITYNGWYATKQTKAKHMYLIYMNKEDLALNNLQWLICHKTQHNQIIYI